MRKQDSTFEAFCRFINLKPVGSTYRTREMIKIVASTETITPWKRSTRTTASARYQTMLKYAGIIKWEGRGRWKILMHVPDWFTSAHLYTVCGHTEVYRWNKKTHRSTVSKRCKMTKEEIRNRLKSPTSVHPSFAGTTVNTIVAERIAQDSTHGVVHTINGQHTSNPRQDLDTAMSSQTTQDIPQPCIAVKITREESHFADQPKKEVDTQEIANLGLLRSAISSVDMITTSDSVIHGRILNALAVLVDIEKSMEAKINAQLFKGKL